MTGLIVILAVLILVTVLNTDHNAAVAVTNQAKIHAAIQRIEERLK